MKILLRDHLHKLHYFHSIAQVGSLRKASEELRISQPSLTHAVKTLEDAAGTKLFIRNSKGVKITEAGKHLLSFCKKTFTELESLQGKFEFPGNKLAGNINVGTYESFATQHWPSFIKSFSRKYQHIKIHLSSGSFKALKGGLLNEDFHVVVAVSAEENPGIAFEPLYDDCFKLYCSSKIQKGKITADIPFILVPSTHCYQFDIERFLWENGIKTPVTYTLDTFEAAKEFVAAGVGFVALPTKIAASDLHHGKIQEAKIHSLKKNTFGKHTIGLLYKKEWQNDSAPNSLVQVFIDALRNSFLQGKIKTL